MKRSGAKRPRVGCCQRISASTPVIRSVSSSTSGWYSRNSSSRSSAEPSSAAELDALDELRAHRRLEARHAALARVLGGIHRDVGVPEHVVRGDVGTGALHAEARRRDDLAPVRGRPATRARGAGARRCPTPRRGSRGPRAGSANSSPPSRAAVSWARRQRRQSLGGRAQQLVANRVAEAVIDRLEVVEIDEDHRELAVVAPAARERQRQAILEQRPVGEAGELVVERLVAELVLERHALGDVAEVEQDPVDQWIADVVVRDHLDRSILAVGGAQPHAQRAGASELQRGLLQEARRGDGVVGVDVVGQPGADDVRGVVAERAAHRLRDPAHLRGAVDHGDDVGGVADERVQSLLAAALGVARLLGDRGPALDPVHPPAEQAQQQQADRQRTEPPEPRALLRRARDAVLIARERRDRGVEATHGGSETGPSRSARPARDRAGRRAVPAFPRRRPRRGAARPARCGCAARRAPRRRRKLAVSCLYWPRPSETTASVPPLLRLASLRHVSESMPAPSVRVRSMTA